MNLQSQIEELYKKKDYTESDLKIFNIFKDQLNKGIIRSAEFLDNEWVVNTWVKMGILVGFRMGKIVSTADPEWGFTDKHTFGIRMFYPENGVRMVPGGSSVRDGAFVAKGVAIMPPSYINVGAYVDENSMIDSHALVGSCAQIGKNVHLSAGSMIGGVLEPINANPVIIEDDVFIGGNCGIYEGVIIKRSAVIAAGVIITASTPVFDTVKGEFLPKPLVIPEKAVVIAGNRTLKKFPDVSVYCPVIIKYRDDKTDVAVKLEDELRIGI